MLLLSQGGFTQYTVPFFGRLLYVFRFPNEKESFSSAFLHVHIHTHTLDKSFLKKKKQKQLQRFTALF